MHLCNKYKRCDERLNMSANFTQLNRLFAAFDSKVRPVTRRIRSMLIAKRLGLSPQPTQELMDKERAEFTDRIMPMLSQQLGTKLYFTGTLITGYDI